MKQKLIKATNFLQKFTVNDGEKDQHVPVIIRDDGIYISAESANSFLFADYYGEYRGGYPWINPEMEQKLKELGYFLEWENPGSLQVLPN